MATRNHLSLRIFAWLFPLFFILFQVSPLLAQTETSNDTTPTAEHLKGQIQEFFDEVLDVDVGWDALQIRHISNVGYGIDNAIGLNGELRDTLAFARQVLQSELFVRSLLQYDHFWARTLNRKNYSPKAKEIERKFDEPYNSNLKFDIVFTPAWDTVNMTVDEARTNNLIAYNVQIKTQAHGTIETRIDQEELTTLLNEALEGETYDKIGSEAKPAVNASMFDGVGFLVGNDTIETDDSNIERIEFTLPSKQAYGFDAYDNEVLAGNYDQVEINGKVYYIPWKSVAKSGTDSLRARVVRRDEEQAIGDTAQFKTGTGVTQPAQVRSGALTYNITTTPLGVEGMESLLATYTITTKDGSTEEVEAGRVNLVVYEKLIQKVILVPVNGIDGGVVPTDIKNALDTIYKQAVVEWDVQLASGITVPEIYDDNQFQDGGTGVFSNYTEEMKKVIKVFDNSYPVDKNTCYLFLLNKPESSGKLGSMPMKKQFGFIYVDNASGTRLAHTIAHELGHGPFRLYHTFSEKNDYYQAKGQTNNLMDYKDPTATRLYKYQWDYIHDPQAMISWLQGEEESEAARIINTEILKGWEYQEDAFPFLALSGKVILLPTRVKNLKFSTGDKIKREDKKMDLMPFGTIMSFTLDGEEYTPKWNEESRTLAYYSSGDKIYNPKELDLLPIDGYSDPIEKVIVGSPVLIGGEIQYSVFQIENTFSTLSDLKANILGAGVQPTFDFIAGGLTKPEEVRVLSTPTSFSEDQNVVDFVKYYKKQEETYKSDVFYDLYLYTHATLLDIYNLLGDCFATGLPGQFMSDFEQYVKITTISVPGAYSTIQLKYKVDPTDDDFEINSKVNRDAFKHIMEQWQKIDFNIYDEYSKIVNEFKTVEVPETITDDNIQDFIDAFKSYTDLETDNFDCIFDIYDTETKFQIIKILLSTDYDEWKNKLEKLTIKIFESLDDNELEYVYTELNTDPTLLFNAYEKLANTFNGAFIARLVANVVMNWRETHLNNIELSSDLENISNEFKKNANYVVSEREFKKILQDENVFLIEDQKLFTGSNSDLALTGEWESVNDGIDISLSKEYINKYGVKYFEFLTAFGVSDINSLLADKIKEKTDLNPLDPVIVFISKSDQIELNLSLPPGLYAVPAIFVYWANDANERAINEFYTRIAIDAVAIALAPFTGGGSVALITFEIALPVADMVMSTINQQVSAENVTWNAIYQTWDVTYMAYGVTLAGIGILKSGPSIVNGVVQGGKKTVKLVANPKLASRFIRVKTIKSWDNLTSIRPQQLADDILKLADNLLINYGQAWADYSNGLKRLANSARLNEGFVVIDDFARVEGYLAAPSDIAGTDIKYVLGIGDSYTSLFTYKYLDNVQEISDIRYLRSSEGVNNVKYVGTLDNVSYVDDGVNYTKVYIVEDANVSGDFYCVTSKELKSSKLGEIELTSASKAAGITTYIDEFVSGFSTSLKSTYDDLIAAGLKPELKPNTSSLLLKNTQNETVAIIHNNKLRPTKWKAAYKAGNATKTETSEGYWLLKDGDDISFDLGFKKTRELEASEVNDYLVNGQGKDLDGQPYWAGTKVNEVVLDNNEIIYFVENYNGGKPNPGQYASNEQISTIKELREKLAVKEAWKPLSNEPTVRAYYVKNPLRTRSGTIGRQVENGVELPGGGHQYEIIDDMRSNWTNYLTPVNQTYETGIKLANTVGTKLDELVTAGKITSTEATTLATGIKSNAALTKAIEGLGNDATKILEDMAKSGSLYTKLDEAPELVEGWKKLLDANVDDAFRRNTGALEALKTAKGSRKSPSTYLDQSYIDNHLSNFERGVTKITAYNPPGAVGPPGGTFVLPKSMADDLIAQAGGDVKKLEDLLGLKRGDLGDSPFRIDVDNPSGLRMPSGNEPGANEFWIPGGKTSGGILEATVDQIQPGTYIKSSVFKY